MTVTPRDIGTYLVTSRTRAGIEHLVDLSDMTCSCEGALEFAMTSPERPCAHVEAACAFVAGVKPRKPRTESPFAILFAKHE